MVFPPDCFLPTSWRRKRWIGRNISLLYSVLPHIIYYNSSNAWFSRYHCYRIACLQVSVFLIPSYVILTTTMPRNTVFPLSLCVGAAWPWQGGAQRVLYIRTLGHPRRCPGPLRTEHLACERHPIGTVVEDAR